MYYEALLMIISCIGFFLSLYNVYIERRLKQDFSYKPLCDISDKISCSKPFTSAYSNIFGFSNAYLGLLFYPTIMGLVYAGYYNMVFYASLAAMIFSFYLAYHLYFTIRSFCLICHLIYLVNISLLVLSYILYR